MPFTPQTPRTLDNDIDAFLASLSRPRPSPVQTTNLDDEIDGFLSSLAPPLRVSASGTANVRAALVATSAPPFDEGAFQSWYQGRAQKTGTNPNPDDPRHMYDYRAAFSAGVEPTPLASDGTYHWPAAYKRAGHPTEVVGGFNTRTGERVPGTPRSGETELAQLGWDPAEVAAMSKGAIPSVLSSLEAPVWAPAKQAITDLATRTPTVEPFNPPRWFRGAERIGPELEGRTVLGSARDLGILGLKAAIGLPEMVVGLLDIPTLGYVGKALESAGYKPAEAKQILEGYYSDPQKRAKAEVANAKGLVATAAAVLSNPSVIAETVGESLPQIAAGGVIGRVIGAATKLAPWVTGALGEGVITAGQQLEQVRQQSPTGRVTLAQATQQTAAGTITGGLSLLGGKIANRLGIADAETLLAGGLASEASKRGLARSIIYGAAQEGLLEELPQSVQEQIWQNISLGKPWDNGVDQAAVLGAFSGAVMGGGAQVVSRMMPGGGGLEGPAPSHEPTTPVVPVPSHQPAATIGEPQASPDRLTPQVETGPAIAEPSPTVGAPVDTATLDRTIDEFIASIEPTSAPVRPPVEPPPLPTAEATIAPPEKAVARGEAVAPSAPLAVVKGEPLPEPAPPSTPVNAPAPGGPTPPTTVGASSLTQAETLHAYLLNATVQKVDARDIVVAPTVYQFKESDAKGDTGALRHVKKWGPSPPVLLHRRVDGTLAVVDGHQRVNAAHRLIAEGKDVPLINAIVVPESEGFSPADMRRAAALINMREDTASPIDIAKVLRDSPLSEQELEQIPRGNVRGGNFAQAEGLAKLGDMAFQAVINGEVKPAHAQYIGQYFTDPGQQLTALRAMAGANVPSPYQADWFLKELAKEMFATEKQGDMFGTHEVSVSLAKEKAQVLGAVHDSLASQKSAFGNAIRNASRLEDAGNRLDVGANERLAAEAKRFQRLLGSFADKSGYTRAALNDAARRVHDRTITPADAVDAVVAALEKDFNAGGPPHEGAVLPSLGQGPGDRGVDGPDLRPVPRAGAVDSLEPVAPTRAELESAGQGSKLGPEPVEPPPSANAHQQNGVPAIILPDGTVLVGGQIHPHIWFLAEDSGVASFEQLSQSTAAFLRPDGTAFDLNGKEIQVVGRVVQLGGAVRPPAVTPPAPATPAELFKPPTIKEQQAEESSPLNVGDPFRIGGVDSVLAKTETIDGVRFELFNASALKDQRATFRQTDVDSGKVVGITQAPTFDAAEAHYDRAVRIAKASAPVDVNEFGEAQPRLPGAESVRDVEVETPTMGTVQQRLDNGDPLWKFTRRQLDEVGGVTGSPQYEAWRKTQVRDWGLYQREIPSNAWNSKAGSDARTRLESVLGTPMEVASAIRDGREPPSPATIEYRLEEARSAFSKWEGAESFTRPDVARNISNWSVAVQRQGRLLAKGMESGDMVADLHAVAVRDAAAAGKRIPPEVLKDYPSFQKRATPEVIDTLDTGEKQPRLPGAESVRDQNVKTPELDVPYSLTSEAAKGPKDTTQDLFSSGAGGSEAGIGLFDESAPVRPGSVPANLTQTRPIEFPELVELARELQSTPEVVRAFRKPGRVGEFRPAGIRLAAELFTKGNERQLAATLAHEIGHLVDWLPSYTLKRGNLIGRLRSLHGFLKHTFSTPNGTVVKNAEIRTELLALSNEWRPWDPSKASASFATYRKSGKELYADAISVLLNNPGLLEEKAPIFYREFFEALNQKPDVAADYFALQQTLAGNREDLIRLSRERVRAGIASGAAKALDLQKQAMEAQQAERRNLGLHLRRLFADKNAPVNDLVKKAIANGVVVPEDENPVFLLEERNCIGEKQKGFLERFVVPVFEALKDAGIAWEDFGEYLFNDRILNGDRGEMANPYGVQPARAQEHQDQLMRDLGPDKALVMKDQVARFRASAAVVAERAHDVGLFTDAMYDQMRENPAYAPFRVVEHMDTHVNWQIIKQIGTLKAVGNPADALTLKMLSTLRAIERQKVTVGTVAWLEKNAPGEIEDAKTRWTGKTKEPMEPRDNTQGLLTYYVKGHRVGKYVDKVIADSVTNESIGHNGALMTILNWVSGAPFFRPLFTTYNLGWQGKNFVRDITRLWANTPEMSFFNALQLYARAFPSGRLRAFGPQRGERLVGSVKPGVPLSSRQRAKEALLQAEEAGILSVTYNDLGRTSELGVSEIESTIARGGVRGMTEPPTYIVGVQQAVQFAGFVRALGDLIETLPKMAAIDYFSEGQGARDLSPAQRSFIRKMVGTPDLLAGGTLTPATNKIAIYSNAAIQGTRSDLHIMLHPEDVPRIGVGPTARTPRASGVRWKMAASVLLPKLMMRLILLGAFGSAAQEVLRRGSTSYDRRNNTVIPLLSDAQGNGVTIKLPPSESGKLIGAVFDIGLDIVFPIGERDIPSSLSELVDYSGGQLPSVSPLPQIVGNIGQKLAGGRVYDAFRGRFVLSEDEAAAGGTRGWKKFVSWELQQSGAGAVWKWTIGPDRPENKTTAQTVLEYPIGSLAQNFIRITSYGETEALRKVQQDVRREEADQRLSTTDAVSKAIAAYLKLPPPQQTTATRHRLAGDIVAVQLGLLPSERAEKQTAIEKRIRMGAIRGNADPLVDAILSATSTAQKVAILEEAAKSRPPGDFVVWLRHAVQSGVISPDVSRRTTRALGGHNAAQHSIPPLRPSLVTPKGVPQ